MRVLIVTEPDDIHAVLVKLALEKKGVDCELLFSADMPTKQTNSIYLSTEEYSWNLMENHFDSFDNHFDSIWWRRPRRPYIPNTLHEEDLDFVRVENSIYHDSIPFLLNEKACWINPISSHQKTRSKIIQLKLAQQCKFKIPETLISNSPNNIKSFIQSNQKQGLIYKSFAPQFWAAEDKLKILYTNKISMDDLPSDPILQAVPGIYQKYVEKKYELRITCFGTHMSAVKIDSQSHDCGQTDWRKIPGQELALSEIKIPQSIRNKIILFMIKIGIVFGCFDFIVTPDDEFIFLELNEQGQFLWVEESLPQLAYLDMFSEFIINKRFDFSWKKSEKIHVSDLNSKALTILHENMSKHVYLNRLKRVA